MYDDSDELSAVLLPLAESVAEDPPPDLREDVLAAALSRRPAGRREAAPAQLSTVDAFARSVADLHALLVTLGPIDAEAHAHEDHDRVRDLIAHLVAVEELSHRWLDPTDEVPFLPDHVAATRATVEELAVLPYDQVFERWHTAAEWTVAAARLCPPEHQFLVHDIPGTVDTLMSLRMFELWAHTMDVAVATGRPIPTPDDEQMQLMSSRLMRGVPGALLYRGASVAGRTARFVLTGPAGGCYDVALDGGDLNGSAPDVTIVGDVTDVCRIAAGRLRPEDLAATIEGDRDLAELVLANLDAFARD